MAVKIPTTQKVMTDIDKMSEREKNDLFDTLLSFITAPWMDKMNIAWHDQYFFFNGFAERIFMCLVQANISIFDFIDISEKKPEIFILFNTELLQEVLKYNLEILALCREEGIHGAFYSRRSNPPEPSEDAILYTSVMNNRRSEFRYILYECWLRACKRTK